MNMIQKQGPSRFTGVGVVVLVHALMIAGLTSAFQRVVSDKKPEPTKYIPIEEPKKPEPPTQVVKLADPTKTLVQPTITLIDPPIFEVQPPTESKPTFQPYHPPSTEQQGTPVGSTHQAAVQQPAKASSNVVSPRSICTRMGRPDLPSVNWSGEALFRVLATVQGGRVVSTEFQLMSGAVDGKTRRQLQTSIANALRDTYECPGEHRFEQDFNIKVD
ncbi:hypothetical protein [Pelomonas sp. SE-A7]|uniref:hypothetical protein n=1 Tax=Pelomonas sp. SE-A7 TaxID=3054953 RepID=UPI00259D1063|nr:hypothetical protein [Pelomonas sp. SE-A7]MDM4764600.1 hypothetical protein [Pelomonas sp. SE-A7]